MKVNVCGLPFEVIETSDHDRCDGMMGRIDTKIQTISLSNIMSKDMKRSTLVHEWLHGVLDMNGFGQESQNEQLVSVLANELTRLGFSPIITFENKKKK